MNKSNLSIQNLAVPIIVLMLLAISFSNVLVAAQYPTQKTTNVTIPASGIFTAAEPELNISYEITGAPGATGTITTATYNGNPNPTATIPNDIALTNFVAVTFNMAQSDFLKAVIVISYTDADLEGITIPYTVYKYIPESDSFIELNSVVDTDAKTISITVNSIEDPLFAIGGTATSPPPTPLPWLTIVVGIVIALIIVTLAIALLRNRWPFYKEG